MAGIVAGITGISPGIPPATAATPADVAITREGQAVRLTIQGENGREYSLEAVEALLNAGSVWKPVATVAPADRPLVLLDPICSTRPQNFYRLRLLQGATPVEVPNFRLLDGNGTAHELFYQSDARAVVLVFAGPDLETTAPIAEDLRSIAADPANAGIRGWIITQAGPADRVRLQALGEALRLPFPILEDEGGAVARALGVETVPEAVAVNPASWSVIYRGRVSASAIESDPTTRQPLLAEALGHFLAGRKVPIRQASAIGTSLPAGPSGERSYAREVAPVLQQRCVGCHSPGNIAPWSMTNYTVVRDYAPMMRDEILTRRMPPWHADRQPQAYGNDSMLSGDELSLLVDWIDQGAPRGDGEDPLATQPPPSPPEWPLGTPDRVVEIEAQSIPANGTVDYRYVIVPNPYPQDVWLRAAVVKPGNPRVVHHVLVFSASGFQDILEIQGGLGGYFAAYVPGMDQVPFPPGTGKRLKRGAFLVFQLHYTATGQPETDRTKLGLYLAPDAPARELRTAAAYTTSFTIPPGASNHPATAEFVLPREAVIHELSPHMHYRGRWFRFEAVHPDGRRETILNVPFYRFDWQTLYRLAEPKRLPAGTRIVATGAWDNSAKNPYNPDSGAQVRFGEQSWEEMFIGYFNWTDAP